MMPTDEERDALRPLVVVLGISVLALWLLPVGSSLWLDETGTFWVTDGTLAELWQRSLAVHAHSPLHSVLIWGVRHLAGAESWALRTPSLIAMLIAAWLLFRLASRTMGPQAAAPTLAVFVMWPTVGFAAADARPYAISLAATLGATLALHRWINEHDDRKLGAAVGWSLLALYMQYIFVLAVGTAWAWALVRSEGRRTRAAAAGAVLLILMIPGVIQMFAYQRSIVALVSPPEDLSYAALAAMMFPTHLLLGGAGGVLLARLLGPLRVRRSWGSDRAVGLSLALALVPLLVLFAAGHLVAAKLFTRRYALAAVPGLALLWGRAAGALEDARKRRVLLAAVAVAAVLASGGRHHTAEDWRAASAAVNAVVLKDTTPVFLHSLFIESKVVESFEDPTLRAFVVAPFLAYPVRGHLLPMPYDRSGDGVAYLEREVVPRILSESESILVTPASELWVPALRERLRPSGTVAARIATAGAVEIWAFRTAEGTASTGER